METPAAAEEMILSPVSDGDRIAREPETSEPTRQKDTTHLETMEEENQEVDFEEHGKTERELEEQGDKDSELREQTDVELEPKEQVDVKPKEQVDVERKLTEHDENEQDQGRQGGIEQKQGEDDDNKHEPGEQSVQEQESGEQGEKVLGLEGQGEKMLEADENAELIDNNQLADTLTEPINSDQYTGKKEQIEENLETSINEHKVKEVITESQENEHVESQEEEQPGEENDEEIKQGGNTEENEDEQAQDALIQDYQILIAERDKIQQQNFQLQNKLFEYFRRKKSEDARPEIQKHVSELEQRYLKYLCTLTELKKQCTIEAACHQKQTEELKTYCEEVVNRVDHDWKTFQEYKKKITLFGVGHQGAGKHALPSVVNTVEQLQTREERKEKEVIQVRLENIKLKNQIHYFESTLKAKEELAEGLHLIDFEQLKIENQTYNEKIEERNEELLKLRKKITNTVELLTHLKEKLQYVQGENQCLREMLLDVEAQVAHKRDILTKTKKARDSLRMDNLKLKQKCGLLGSELLLRDYEEKVDSTEELSQKLENLKRHHAELTLSTKGLIKKIEETKSAMQK
ncbi:coiled-coil domain-containing protein 96 [Bombina bombina]|uniref:coiled-coil domain-containing protein 96 n=1 Tax=Bombina bombina TaxID=8345 RepID=UPI00235AC5CC|nr:coiled-coil domain-containing protein 96 [Bombina bombina]